MVSHRPSPPLLLLPTALSSTSLKMRFSFLYFLFTVLAFTVLAEAAKTNTKPKPTPKPVSLAGISNAKAQAPVRQIVTFCQRYRAACLDEALRGQSTGERTVVHACKKKKDNVNYTLGCKVGKKDLTAAALRKLSAGTTSLTTTTLGTSTATVSSTTTTSTTALTTATELSVTT